MKENSIEDFVRIIKATKYTPVTSAEDNDLSIRKDFMVNHYGVVIKMLKEKFPKYSLSLDIDSIFNKKVNGYDTICKFLFEELKSIIPDEYTNILDNHIFLSSVETEDINADIHKSYCNNFFAIFLNSSLISLLSKVQKLTLAQINPGCVEFCNRISERKPNKEELSEMRKEYFKYFKENKLSYGPFLVLNKEMSIQYILQLSLQEKFIFYHEIGHFLSGDLFEKDSEIKDFIFENEENILYRKEYFADMIAFHLLLKSEKKESVSLSPKDRIRILITITALFDVFHELQDKVSDTHPEPLKRLFCICDYFYGVEITEILAESYSNKAELIKLFSVEEKIISREDLVEIIIKELYKFAFNMENWK